MKRIVMFAFALILAGAGCAASPQPQVQDTVPEEPADVEEQPGVVLEAKDEVPNEPSGQDGDHDADPEADAVETSIVQMTSGNFFFEPAVIRAEVGQEVEVVFAENSGVHTFVIDELGVNVPISAGDSTTFTADLEPGTYAFYCSVGNHRALGMEGTLIVE